MEFLTGSRTIPPSGFELETDAPPTILFDDGLKGLPVVSTCALTITFPTSFPIEQRQFDHNMDLAITSGRESFGQI